jgi:hypothetical protein
MTAEKTVRLSVTIMGIVGIIQLLTHAVSHVISHAVTIIETVR